jgi:hypothetical protein
MKKGSGIPHVTTDVRIPIELHKKLVESKQKTKCRSLNRMFVSILAEYFQRMEAETVVQEG